LNNAGDRDALLANPDAVELPLEKITADQVFVAEFEGEIIGFAVVLPRLDGGAELDGLFVEPPLWKYGVGRSLVHHCEAIAIERGSTAMYVVGNPHAEGLYLACGFEIIGVEQTRFGSGLLMRKSL
jgi:GNAT superfamily N-acetyltransferase